MLSDSVRVGMKDSEWTDMTAPDDESNVGLYIWDPSRLGRRPHPRATRPRDRRQRYGNAPSCGLPHMLESSTSEVRWNPCRLGASSHARFSRRHRTLYAAEDQGRTPT